MTGTTGQHRMLLAICLLACCTTGQTQAATIPATEVATHASADDCWMTIEGHVYDLTDYLPAHDKFKYDLRKWCGKDATSGWRDKDGADEPHSRKAGLLLKKYLIGDSPAPAR